MLSWTAYVYIIWLCVLYLAMNVHGCFAKNSSKVCAVVYIIVSSMVYMQHPAHLMEESDSLVVHQVRVQWRYVWMVHGVLCVTTTGIYLMLRWCVDSLDMKEIVRFCMKSLCIIFWLCVLVFIDFQAYTSATFGEGYGPLMLGYVSCNGDEASLLNCEHTNDTTQCDHSSDAGVDCLGKSYM